MLVSSNYAGSLDVRHMRRALPLYFVVLLTAGFIQLGCKTSPTKPSTGGRAIEAGPGLERFLISHGFHREEREIYTRQYHSLKEAGEDLGTSLFNLPVSPNGPGLEIRDERVFELHAWGFTVLAETGRTLDDPNTPCTVGTSLIQGH